jgi:hypothetical protein
MGLHLRGGSASVHLSDAPSLGVVAEQLLARQGVDVEAAREVPPDTVEELLGIDLPGEVLRPLRTARIFAPPCPVSPVGSLVDACHRDPSCVRASALPNR